MSATTIAESQARCWIWILPQPFQPPRRSEEPIDMLVGIYAAHQALLHSGLDLEKTDLEQVGAFIGSGIGGLSTLEKQHSILENKGPARVSPS